MHKAFINDKPLIFEDVYKTLENNNQNLLILSDAEYSIDVVLKKIEEEKIYGIIYLCARPDQEWNDFISRYILVEAAGGIVMNEKGEVLVIYRKKRWDLPKGKLDYNESPEDAAVREVKEECGIEKIELGKFILKTFHTYNEKKKSILKKTHWFEMVSTDKSELVPQIEEDIEKVLWMSRDEIKKIIFPNTYASIQDVLKTYFENQ